MYKKIKANDRIFATNKIGVINGKGPMEIKGIVVKEYPGFYLIDTGKYKTCLNKASIHCGDIVIH